MTERGELVLYRCCWKRRARMITGTWALPVVENPAKPIDDDPSSDCPECQAKGAGSWDRTCSPRDPLRIDRGFRPYILRIEWLKWLLSG